VEIHGPKMWSDGQGINGEHRVWELGVTEPQGKRGQDP